MFWLKKLKLLLIKNNMKNTPIALREEEWFGVWDKLEEKIIYIYKDQLSGFFLKYSP